MFTIFDQDEYCGICSGPLVEPCNLPNAEFCTHKFCRLCLKFWFKASPIISERIYHKTYCPKCRDIGYIYTYKNDLEQFIPIKQEQIDLNQTTNFVRERDELGLELDYEWQHF